MFAASRHGLRYDGVMSDSQTPSPARAPGWRALSLLVLLALAVRGGAVFALRGRLQQDTDAYRSIAENLRNHGVFARGPDQKPTAYRPPLYPMVLSLAVVNGRLSLLVVGILHTVIGVATVCGVFLLAHAWRLRTPECWVAALLTLADPLLLYQSSELMTETLAALLTVALLATLHAALVHGSWRWALSAGVVTGLAGLCRPTFLPLAGLAAILLARGMRSNGRPEATADPAARSPNLPDESPAAPPSAAASPTAASPSRGLSPSQAGWPARGALVAAYLLAVLLTLSPWVARNWFRFRRPLVGTTHGGYTFLLGNNRGFYQYLRDGEWGAIWNARELDRRVGQRLRELGGDEFALDRWAYGQAATVIRDEPGMFVRACLTRIARLWGVLPHQVQASETTVRRLARFCIAGWYLGVFFLVAVGVWRLGGRLLRSPWVAILALCLTFTVVHAFYWSNLRMRAPLMPALALLAACGVRRRSDVVS